MTDLPTVLSRSQRLVVADGAGAPWTIVRNVSSNAGNTDGASGEIFVGWCLGDGLKDVLPGPNLRFRSFMGGNGTRHMSSSEHFSYVPIRFSHLPRALATWMRPYTLVVAAVPVDNGWRLGTEAGWIPAAIESASDVVVCANRRIPDTTAVPTLSIESAATIETDDAPEEFLTPAIDDVSARIAEHVIELLPEDAAIQYGPGPIGAACVSMLRRPTRIRSGIVSDVVVDAIRRGKVIGKPVGAYAVGSHAFYDAINGLEWVDRVERTHDHASLCRDNFFAINTALEIDMSGQVNVESIKGSTVAGLGGHADFAFAAASSRHGLSIIALPSTRGSNATLVEHLGERVTTQRSDIDVVVTERGSVDLRGLSDSERRIALSRLWGL